MGYTPRVRNQLADEAKVVRPTLPNGNAENCAGTSKGIDHIDRWLDLDGGNWDVIHFNFGLHDLKRVHPETGRNSNDASDPYQASPELYERQLREIVSKLKASGAELVYATTTPVPRGEMRPYRAMEDPVIYNAVAERVMAAEEIPINDLYAFSLPRLEEIQQAANVHFTREGSRALADQVIRSLREALARR
ncbi:MAG: SGNH/GDSL hydrolase family protein, partial [Planctomycetota bacterium]|jgi:acyl-CoA thioesterase-1